LALTTSSEIPVHKTWVVAADPSRATRGRRNDQPNPFRTTRCGMGM